MTSERTGTGCAQVWTRASEALLRAASFVVACAVLGCSGAIPVDVGPTDGGPADTAIEPMPACPVERVCPRVIGIVTSGIVSFGAVAGGNVALGPGLMSMRGIAMPWGALPCCGTDGAAAGIALLEDGQSLTVSTGSAALWRRETPLPTFARSYELAAVDPFGAFDRIMSIDIDAWSLGEATTAPLGGSPDAPPAVLGVGQAVAALIGPAPRFVILDAPLTERLVDMALPGSAAQRLMLTETCNGLLASWTDDAGGRLHSVALDRLGQRRSEVQEVEVSADLSLLPPTATWDGAAVVVTLGSEVLEIGADATILSRTHAPSDVLAAVGTDQGILALLSTQGDASDPILASIERTTGSVLQNFGALNLGSAYGITGSAAAAQRSVYFASSSYQTRDQLAWLRVDCTR